MGTHEHDPAPQEVIGPFIHIQWLQDQASLAQESMWPVHVIALAVQLNQGYVVHVSKTKTNVHNLEEESNLKKSS